MGCEGFGEVGGHSDAPPPSGKGIRDQSFGRYDVATVVMEILLGLMGLTWTELRN